LPSSLGSNQIEIGTALCVAGVDEVLGPGSLLDDGCCASACVEEIDPVVQAEEDRGKAELGDHGLGFTQQVRKVTRHRAQFGSDQPDVSVFRRPAAPARPECGTEQVDVAPLRQHE
jgi:hypothetical protein